MAISDVAAYAHLTPEEVEELARELDQIRADVESTRGDADARYIHRVIRAQRALEAGGRLALLGSRSRVLWCSGVGMLALAKIIENMELGHNIIHGQWDWMNDPEIHSTSWEWDMACPSAHWMHSHNYMHHKYTNVVGLDLDVGYGVLRVTRDERWQFKRVFQPLASLFLGVTFEWGIALHDIELAEAIAGNKPWPITRKQLAELGLKSARQVGKDFVAYPLVSRAVGGSFRRTFTANLTANVIRNLWTYAVIFCGHFPDGAEKFTPESIVDETEGEWYLRQMLGSANITGGPVMDFLSGNLSYQIEHHLFPDLPSNRLASVAVRVRALCEKYDLPYTEGSLAKQYGLTSRTIAKLALPDRWLRATSDDAPETASELRFVMRERLTHAQESAQERIAHAQESAHERFAHAQEGLAAAQVEVQRKGLRTALAELAHRKVEEKRRLREERRRG
ncbi:acyl-CoA desaturase [Tsukamurella sp. 8F]|uniref:fatty acid desaturase family protein n=1 Tax=unclassified Tsukamurella TaxID=2633480 RepID=UPI0023BA0B3D|nr:MULTISPECIES: acyl-CoA desaturase [unclassified Tsukamurella]MDF0529055.1 acyl-CoA desaturase [Tsukamurella sp. 8J]MDF0587428.1 acyl-CoA desaturase [Tsukamurella sp. 8F]